MARLPSELSRRSCSLGENVVTVIFTLDYEIHGNGEGCSYELMVEPTDRLLRLFSQHNAKLTIMADVAEILKFKEYAEHHGKDDYHFKSIVKQLQSAVRDGHDVQLHIHASYFNATHDGRRWVQDWSEYDFAGLSRERLSEVIKIGKSFLESLLQPVQPAYRCKVFRAANWSVSPSANVVSALLENAIHIDSSVFKYGRRDGLLSFDYSLAHSDMLPWRASRDAIWQSCANSKMWEVPIYCENRRLGAFLSVNRIYRSVLGHFHKFPAVKPYSNGNGGAVSTKPTTALESILRWLGKHAWKADFNQCTGGQLIRALERGAARYAGAAQSIPFVLIGHSKLFTSWNERTLRPFLAHVGRNSSRFQFGTFDSLGLEP